MKKIIRLTESDLHRIVKESVQKVLEGTEYWSEEDFNPNYPGDDEEEEDPLTKYDNYRQEKMSRKN